MAHNAGNIKTTGAQKSMIQISQQSRSGWSVVEVIGRVDAGTAAQLEEQLRTAVQNNAKVAVDFSGVAYISSAGIRAILQAARAAQEGGIEFAICAPSETARQVFEISGLQNIMTIKEALPC
jgi:anti-sigma B factor antagonist